MPRPSYSEAAKHGGGGMAMLLSGKTPEGGAFTMPVGNAVSDAVADGRFYFGGTGKLDLTVAGNIRAVIENPAGSGRNVYVARLTGLATGTGWADLVLNPTAGIPAATRPINNAVLGLNTGPVAIVRADVDTTVALGGGTATGVSLGIPNGEYLSIDLAPFVLTPGNSLGINDAFAGAASASMNLYWWERDL